MRSSRLSAFLKKTIFVCLPFFACFFSAQPAFALKLVSSITTNLTEPNPYDLAKAIYKADNGDLYLTGTIKNQAQKLIARYTPELTLISSAAFNTNAGYTEWSNIVVDHEGNVFVAAGFGQFDVLRFSPELAFVSSATFRLGYGYMSGLAISPEGTLFVTGVAGDIYGSDHKGYLIKMSSALSIISSTTLLTGGTDTLCDVAVSTTGMVYAVVVGSTNANISLFEYDAYLNPVSSSAVNLGEGTGAQIGLHLLNGHIGDVIVGWMLAGNSFVARFDPEVVFVSSSVILDLGYITGLAAAEDGSLHLAGYKNSEVVLVKISSTLVVESSATYSFRTELNGIAAGPEGNLFVSGGVSSVIGGETNSDLWLGKFNNAHSYISSVTINGGQPDSYTHLDSVALGPDGKVYVSGGGYYLNSGLLARYTPHLVLISSATGFNSKELMPMDMDQAGNLYFLTDSGWWGSSYPSTRTLNKYDQELQFVSSMPFNGCFKYSGRLKEISGNIFLSGQGGCSFFEPTYIWKYNSDLTLQSTVPFYGVYGFYGIAADEDGNVYPIGISFPSPGGGASDSIVTKHAPDLMFLASSTVTADPALGDVSSSVVVSTSIQRVFVGGLINNDAWIGKYDYDLNLISSITIFGIQGDWANTRVNRMVLAPDLNLLATGAFQNKLWLARISPDLVILSSMTIDFPENTFDEGTSVAVSRSGDVYVVGGSGPSSIEYLRTAWLGWFTYADEAAPQPGVLAGVPAFTAVSTGNFNAVWTSTYPADTRYYASISTSPDFTPVLASSSTYNKSANFSGLAVNTTYYARVYDQLKGAMVDLGFISTLTMPPTFPFLDNVWSSSAAISWMPNGNPDWTKYVIGLWDGGVSSATIASVSTTSAVIGLPEGSTVYISVRSMNNDGVFMPFYPIISLLTLPAAQTAVQTGVDKTVLYNAPSGEIKANIPAGSFPEAVNVTLKTPAAWNVPSPTAGLLALHSPINLEVTLDKVLQPARNVEITVGYRDADLGGMDENKLVLARYDEAHGVWVPLPSTRDAANNKITAATRHFSLFQVMQVTPAATLTGVTVGPNPLRPSRTPGQKFTFRNLPADGRVRIYTYLGELLYETRADASGMAVWDGRNKANNAVASGLYLALVQGSGGKKMIKLVIER